MPWFLMVTILFDNDLEEEQDGFVGLVLSLHNLTKQSYKP